MRFFIEQVALCPRDPVKAVALLSMLGLEDWAHDTVIAAGSVYGKGGQINKAHLAFNYQGSRGLPLGHDVTPQPKPLELEVLHYAEGANWMDAWSSSVSHLGMHCTAEELVEWRAKFAELGYQVAQEVMTQSHTNPVIDGQRWYNYVIFDTREVLGVDLKFIVRLSFPGLPS